MTPERITFVLTALATVVVVLTRIRLSAADEDAAGRVSIPNALVNAHTFFGVLALGVWGYYLVEHPAKVIGVLGLGLWWLTALAGLLILLRWLPARGRHAAPADADSWGEGPGLSMLGHLGLIFGALVWTYFLFADKIGG